MSKNKPPSKPNTPVADIQPGQSFRDLKKGLGNTKLRGEALVKIAPPQGGKDEHPAYRPRYINNRWQWEIKPDKAARHDQIIKRKRDFFVSMHPPEHHDILNSFIDHIANHPNRHLRSSYEPEGNQLRARHVANLLDTGSHTRLQVKSPNLIAIQAIRHPDSFGGEPLEPTHAVLETYTYTPSRGLHLHRAQKVLKESL